MFSIKNQIEDLHIDDLGKMLKMLKGKMIPYILMLILGSLVFTSHQIAIAFINRELINAIITKQFEKLYTVSILSLFILLIVCVVQPILGYYFEKLRRQGIIDIRTDVYRVVQKLPIKYFEKNHSGDIISRSSNDINVFSNAYGWQLDWGVTVIIWGFGSMIVTFWLEWRLSIVMVLLGVISLFFNLKFASPIRKISNEIQQSMGLLTQNLSDIIAGFRVMKVFNLNDIVAGRYYDENCRIVDSNMQRVKKNSMMGSVSYLMDSFSVMGVIIAGSFLIANKAADLGTVMAIITLQAGVASMFSHLGGVISMLQASLAGVGRVAQLMEEEIESKSYDVFGAEKNSNTLVIEDISFGYKEDELILKDVSFIVKKGKVAAIVGPSGSGKSTIFKLLLGYYPPNSGRITIEESPLSDYTLSELRELISYVPQDAFLFDDTIEENIKYGRLNATSEEIRIAAKKANAHEFIEQLSEGYATKVGERGVKLSGGQKQRIAIARALLKDAPILLLDEATSSLDSESEQLIQEALNNLMEGRTVVVIAHRLSTIEHADIIYVLKNGYIVEEGSHDELHSSLGFYSSLYDLQFKHYMEGLE